MKAASDRITSGPIDPDLEAALPELTRRAARFRQLNSMLASPTVRLKDLQPQKTERADLVETFRTAAIKHQMKGDEPWLSLLLLVEEADRLYIARKRQRPTLAQVLANLHAVVAAADRDAENAAVEARLADGAAREAARRFRAAQGATAYLEACRG